MPKRHHRQHSETPEPTVLPITPPAPAGWGPVATSQTFAVPFAGQRRSAGRVGGQELGGGSLEQQAENSPPLLCPPSRRFLKTSKGRKVWDWACTERERKIPPPLRPSFTCTELGQGHLREVTLC